MARKPRIRNWPNGSFIKSNHDSFDFEDFQDIRISLLANPFLFSVVNQRLIMVNPGSEVFLQPYE